MSILNYGGVDYTVEELRILASNLEKEASEKAALASRTTNLKLRDEYTAQANARQNEAQAIYRFVGPHTK